MRLCTYTLCTNKHSAKGFCKAHYLEFCRKQLNSAWYRENKTKKAEKSAQWFSENKGSWKEYNAKLYIDNKQTYTENNRRWKRSNPSKLRAYRAKYRASLLLATPKWADLKKIEEVYLNCPSGYEVDHIYPLQGKTVCGLHVDYNLQYLTTTDNRRKGKH